MSEDTIKSTSKTILRALDIMEYLASRPVPASATELSKEFHVNRSTLYATLNTLCGKDYVEKDEVTKRYSIGYKAYEIGTYFTLRHTFLKLADALTRKIQEQYNLHLTFGILRKPSSVLTLNYNPIISIIPGIDNLESPTLIMPLYASAIGKILLAGMDPETFHSTVSQIQFIPYTNTTITSLEALIKEVTEVRENGYAKYEYEYINANYSIAAPVYDHSGKTIAGIALSTSEKALFDEIVPEIVKEIQSASERISITLGWNR